MTGFDLLERRLLPWLDRRARWVLVALMLGYTLLVSVAAIRKFQLYRMGFDLGLIQQAIWNTLHGRLLATHAYDFTDTLMGTDSFFVWLVFAPLYALAPTPATLLILQTVTVATGAIPVYLLARDRVGPRWVGLLLAAVYLMYPPVFNGNLYEVRERVMAMVFMLWLLLCLERGWFWRMLIPLTLALSCRLDTTVGVALVGVYALLTRRPWRFAATLIVAAIAWNLIVTAWPIPSFTARPGYLFSEHYAALGASPGEIVQTALLRPLYTLGVMWTPLGPKLMFVLGMLVPLAFLALGDWRTLVVVAPLVALNLLSARKIQWDIYHHYQGLLVPWLVLGAITTLARLGRRAPLGPRTLPLAGAALLGASLVSQLIFGNPVPALLVTPTSPRLAVANRLAASVPSAAPLAVGSLLTPHVAPREGLFLVPGDDFHYAAQPFARAEYALLDLRNSALARQVADPLRNRCDLAQPDQFCSAEAREFAAQSGWCVMTQEADYLVARHTPALAGNQCEK